MLIMFQAPVTTIQRCPMVFVTCVMKAKYCRLLLSYNSKVVDYQFYFHKRSAP